MPRATDIPIPCQQCRLLDFYVIYNESKQQSAVVCQNCAAPFIQIQYVPETTPDPAVII